MSKNKYPEETIQKILNASLKLFLEKGYEETTILDIVNELGGLTRGAFYHHFKSKEEVLNSLSDKLFFENNSFAEISSRIDLNGLEKIKMIIKSQFKDSNQQEINLMAIPLLKNSKILATFLENNERVLTPLFSELFDEALKDGSIDNEFDSGILASFTVHILNVWLPPLVTPCSKEVTLEKLYFSKKALDRLGIPIIDEEILSYAKNNLEKIKLE